MPARFAFARINGAFSPYFKGYLIDTLLSDMVYYLINKKGHAAMELKDRIEIKNGRLAVAGCDCVELAREYGTPLYVMDEERIRANCRALVGAMKKYAPGGRVMYASKAFMNKAMCLIAAGEGLGLDVVSGGELYTALEAGVPGEIIEMHGNNKTYDEIKMAINARVSRIIIDGFDEIERIEKAAAELGAKRIPVLIRIRPGIEAHTHQAVQTANLDCKFGFNMASGEAMKAARLLMERDTFDFKGIHCHIGSQIFEIPPFEVLIGHFMGFATQLRDETGYIIEDFNCGGGFGVRYVSSDDPKEPALYIQHIAEALNNICARHSYPVPRITVEPGRSIVAEAGYTLYTIGGVKEIPGVRTYVSVDGGMFDNPRCALYGSEYTVVSAQRPDAPHTREVTIAGKCCESGDLITEHAFLPQDIKSGELIAVLTTGAYNYSMASNYNRNTVPAVVLANNGHACVIVRRESYEDLVSRDIVPEQLAK